MGSTPWSLQTTREAKHGPKLVQYRVAMEGRAEGVEGETPSSSGTGKHEGRSSLRRELGSLGRT